MAEEDDPTEVLTEKIPETVRPIALIWAGAVNKTITFMRETPLPPDHAHDLLEMILQSAAAVFGPGDLDLSTQESVVRSFREHMVMMDEEYKRSRAEAVSTLAEAKAATKQ